MWNGYVDGQRGLTSICSYDMNIEYMFYSKTNDARIAFIVIGAAFMFLMALPRVLTITIHALVKRASDR